MTAFEMGRAAFWDGFNRSENPFPEESADWEQWGSGFDRGEIEEERGEE